MHIVSLLALISISHISWAISCGGRLTAGKCEQEKAKRTWNLQSFVPQLKSQVEWYDITFQRAVAAQSFYCFIQRFSSWNSISLKCKMRWARRRCEKMQLRRKIYTTKACTCIALLIILCAIWQMQRVCIYKVQVCVLLAREKITILILCCFLGSHGACFRALFSSLGYDNMLSAQCSHTPIRVHISANDNFLSTGSAFVFCMYIYCALLR